MTKKNNFSIERSTSISVEIPYGNNKTYNVTSYKDQYINGDFLLATFNGDYVYDYNQGTKVGLVCVNDNTSKAFLLTIKH